MAEKLIEGMSAAFEPDRYHDTYRADLLNRIEEKVTKGETHALAAEEGADARRPARAKSRSAHGRAHPPRTTHRKRA